MASGSVEGGGAKESVPFHRTLYAGMLLAIACGAVLGWVRPAWGIALQPLGELFIRLVKMLIAPVVFCTVTVGVAAMGDIKRVGAVGARALLYFEVVTTFALGIGFLVVEWVRPGEGIHQRADALDTRALAGLIEQAPRHKPGLAGLVEQLIPEHFVGALARGGVLQVLVVAILFGAALATLKERGKPMLEWLERASEALFAAVGIVMKLAPIGAFGAMAFTVGRFGIGTLANLAGLMVTFYVTSALFVLFVLAPILRVIGGLSPWRFFAFLKDEFFLVLGTSSSESALPGLMAKLERLGCARPVVGLVVPTGYSFNLDGTSIYLTMAAMFVAQATDTPLTLAQKLSLLAMLLVTSKGAAAVSGGGLITLAATLSATGEIPVAGLALLLGIDRFMSEVRALTNLAGNAVATVVIARWEGALDRAQAAEVLGRDLPRRAERPGP
jgi:aerobic C4-dicarboxylate transport protein